MLLLVIILAFVVYEKYTQSWPTELMSERALAAHTYVPLLINHIYTAYTGLLFGPRVQKDLAAQIISCALLCFLSVYHTTVTIS